MTIARGLLAIALSSLAIGAGAVNLLQNPAFDDGGAGWQSNSFQFGVMGAVYKSGAGEARTGCVGAPCLGSFGSGSYLRQWLPTVIGETYDLSFLARSYTGVGEYTVFWDGVMIDDRVVANGAMVAESYASLAVSSINTVLEIHGRNDPDYIYFDNFVVQQSVLPNSPNMVGNVPEPMSWLMLVAGIVLLTYSLRRRP
ncbi:MAG: PEP-CTERM sorting domain-containing protein [Massilia sp.]